jgi:hypothetical protein
MDPTATVILHETKKLMPSAKKATLITQTTDIEIPYHSVKTTTQRIFKMMSARRLAIRTQKPQKDSTATHLNGQGVRPLQTFFYLPDTTALRITKTYFPILIAHTVINKTDGPTPLVEMHRSIVLYLLHLTAKGNGRREVEWVTRCQRGPHSNK